MSRSRITRPAARSKACGVVTVEKKGNVIADRILCGGLIVRGKVKGDITEKAADPCWLARAEIKGDVIAPTMAVGAGAILEGDYRVGPNELQPKKT